MYNQPYQPEKTKAIIKVIPANDGMRKDAESISTLINYIADHPIDGGIQGIGCSNNPEEAAEQFVMTKKVMNKKEGVQCRHYLISFEEAEWINCENIGSIAYNIALFFWGQGYQTFYGIHQNSNEGMHVHIAVNTVNLYTGKKLPISRNFKQRFIDYIRNLDFCGRQIWVLEADSYY